MTGLLLTALAFLMSTPPLRPAVEPASRPSTLHGRDQGELEARVRELVEGPRAKAPGAAIWVWRTKAGEGFGAAWGHADPGGRPMTVDTPVRIASNTKTFTAATFLRLWERGRVDLDAPLRELVDKAFLLELERFGYDVDGITARQLLMHTSGLPDHAERTYIQLLRADPDHVWTRREQLLRVGTMNGPLADPGAAFHYSDTGYVLLGHAIERITGSSLAAAARTQLEFERLGLRTTYWERLEAAPKGAASRAHQYVGGEDFTELDPSADLYGGGGLVCSVRDLATFFARLLGGDVFANRETLRVMTQAPGHAAPEAYRIGLFPRRLVAPSGNEEVEAFGHSGFWGTVVRYAPELDVAVAGVVLDQAAFPALVAAVDETLLALGG